jgi:2-polyprenyl-6-methoxyphenol hydroxylase-like FAD-dependent oxidoreductase
LPTTTCAVRRYLLADGGVQSETRMPQRFTSWDAIYQTLRATFPNSAYHWGDPVIDFAAEGEGVSVNFAAHAPVTADLLVCADGARSEARRSLSTTVRQWVSEFSVAPPPSSLVRRPRPRARLEAA